MTAPFLEPTLGVDSDLAREEFAEFQRKKAELLAGILQRTGIGQGFGRPVPGTVAVGPMSLYVPPEVQALMQSPSASAMEQTTQDVEDLLAAARYWKIEGAEDMPVEVLRALIEERRNTIARPEELDPETALLALGGLGANVVQGATDIVANLMQAQVSYYKAIPFVGEALNDILVTEEAKDWLRRFSSRIEEFDESVAARLPERDRTAYTVYEGTGHMVSYIFPGTASWKAAGALGKAGQAARIPVVSAIFRSGAKAGPWVTGAFQGGTAAAMLEAGSLRTPEERALNVGLGAVLGGAGEMLVQSRWMQAMMARVRKDIQTPLDRRASRPATATATALGQPETPPMLAGPDDAIEIPESAWRPPETVDIDPVTGDPISPRLLPAPETPPPDAPGLYIPRPDEAQGMLDEMAASGFASKPPTAVELEPSVANIPTVQAVRRAQEVVGPQEFQARALREIQSRPNPSDPLVQAAATEETARKIIAEEIRSTRERIIASTTRVNGQEFDAPTHGEAYSLALDAGLSPVGEVEHGFRTESGRFITREEAGRMMGRWNTPESPRMIDAISEDMPYYKEILEARGRAIREARTQGKGLPADEASETAFQITKQAEVMQSELLPDLADVPRIDEGHAALAARANNPAGVSVLRGVTELDKVVEKLADEPFALVQREGRTDVLIGEFSPEQIAQYEATGRFTGQKAVTANGIEVQIINPSSDLVQVRKLSGGPPFKVKAANLMPGNQGLREVEAPALYDAFKAEALEYMNQEAARAKMAPVDWTDPRMSESLPAIMERFFDQNGINTKAERVALESYFSSRRVADYRSLEPEAASLADEASALADDLSQSEAALDRPEASIEELAEAKGFEFEAAPGEGGILRDRNSTLEVPVATDEAAEDFLQNLNRELPDITPLGDTPVEVAGLHPDGTAAVGADPSIQGEDLTASIAEAIDDLEADEIAEEIVESFDTLRFTADDLRTMATQPDEEIALWLDRMGAGPEESARFFSALADVRWRASQAVVPTPPAGGGGAGGGGGLPPRVGRGPQPAGELPPGEGRLGAQFQRADQGNLGEMIERYVGLVSRWFTPTRYRMMNLQRDMEALGINAGRAFDFYYDITQGLTQMHNRARPWHEEWAHLMQKFPRQLLRKGMVTRIHEMPRGDQRARAYARIWTRLNRGSTDTQAQARWVQEQLAKHDELSAFMHRFFLDQVNDPKIALEMEREIFRYIPHVRARQGTGARDPFADKDSILNPAVKYFAEMARDGNMQFRRMDARDLGHYMIRARFFKSEVGDVWSEAVRTWQDPRIPPEIRGIMTRWLEIVRKGYDPSGDMVISGVKSFFGAFGLKLNQGEVATLLNTPMGWSYRAMLGRPAALFRDAIQPWMVSMKTGPGVVREVYADFLKNPALRAEMRERARANGWVEGGLPQIEVAGVFERELANQAGVSRITPGQARFREGMARVGDVIYDRLPHKLTNMQGTWVDPLMAYTRLGEVNRTIAGEAGFRVASRSILRYRAWQALKAGMKPQDVARDPELRAAMVKMLADGDLSYSMDKLLKESTAATFGKPVRDRFKRLVQNGDYEEASKFLANNMADWSQQRYGSREVPEGLRGFAGRLAFQFGNFSLQFLHALGEAARAPEGKTRAYLTLGAITAGLAAAKHATGWSFDKWIWLKSLGFSGGPLLDPAIAAYQATSAFLAQATGGYVGREQEAAMQRALTDDYGSPLEAFFPWAGIVRTAADLELAAQGPNPAEAIPRTLITGDRGSTIEAERGLREVQEAEAAWLRGDTLTREVPTTQRMPGGGNQFNASRLWADGITNASDLWQYLSRSPVGPTAFTGPMNIPPPADAGASDPSRVYMKNGYPVYDSQNIGADRRTPTHRLDVSSGRAPGETWEQYEARVNADSTWSDAAFRPVRDIRELEPDVQMRLAGLMEQARVEGVDLRIAETHRPQERQEYLFQQGRGRPGSIVTWTLTSNHGQRRAVDFIVNGDLTGRDPGYQWLWKAASQYGFQSMGAMDPGHIAVPGAGARQ